MSTICLNQQVQILLVIGQLIAMMAFGPSLGRIVKIGMDGVPIQAQELDQ